MGLVAWMLIVMMMGAGIGRTSHTLELRGARRINFCCSRGAPRVTLRQSGSYDLYLVQVDQDIRQSGSTRLAGNRYLVQGTWYLVPGPGTWHQVLAG